MGSIPPGSTIFPVEIGTFPFPWTLAALALPRAECDCWSMKSITPVATASYDPAVLAIDVLVFSSHKTAT